MEENIVFFQEIIDIPLWNEAQWCGMAVLSTGNSAPMLAFLFSNENYSKEIFGNWIKKLGNKDIYEEIRISIILGDIPNINKGYTIHICSNFDNYKKKSAPFRSNTNQVLYGNISRYQTFESDKGEKNMLVFKEEFEKYLSFFIIPAILTEGKVEPLYDLAIEKTEITFLDYGSIEEGSVDSVCFNNLN